MYYFHEKAPAFFADAFIAEVILYIIISPIINITVIIRGIIIK